jgi:hypothetical protein
VVRNATIRSTSTARQLLVGERNAIVERSELDIGLRDLRLQHQSGGIGIETDPDQPGAAGPAARGIGAEQVEIVADVEPGRDAVIGVDRRALRGIA